MATVDLPGRLNAPSWNIETKLKSSLLTALQHSKTFRNSSHMALRYKRKRVMFGKNSCIFGL